MTHDVLAPKEAISALADGQLRGEEFACTVELLAEQEDARVSWHAYHLVGDVLRSGELASSSARDAAFVARLRQRLQDEVAGTAPRMEAVFIRQAAQESANAGNFRWKLVAGLASLAAVSVLGWQVVSGSGATGLQLAQQTVPVTVSQTGLETQQVMIRDPHLDQLLAAHQQFGGTSALQMPAGFLRNATFERSAR